MTSLVEAGLGNALVAFVLGLFALVVGLVARRPAVAHALWLLVLIKLVTPPLVHVPLWPAPAAPMAPVESPDLSIVPEPEITGEIVLVPAEAAENEPEAHANAPAVEILPPTEEVAAVEEVPVEGSWQGLVGGVWLFGSVVWFSVAMHRLRRFGRLLRHAETAPGWLVGRVAELSRQLGLKSPPQVCLVGGRLSPMVWGMFRAKLLVPVGLIRQLKGPALETLLAHELAHVRRRDHWVRWLEFIGLGLYWWNPVVWLARRELREAEELCCDAWVVRCLPDARRVFANALVDALDFLSAPAEAVPALGCGLGRVEDLKWRLTMILRGSIQHRLGWTTALSVAGLALLILPLVPGLSTAQQPKPETPDLKQLPPKVQAEIDELIKRHMAEAEKQRAEAAQKYQAALANKYRVMIQQGRAQLKEAHGASADVADLEKLLRQRADEIEMIKKKLDVARGQPDKPGPQEKPSPVLGGRMQILIGGPGLKMTVEISPAAIGKGDAEALLNRIKEAVGKHAKTVQIHVTGDVQMKQPHGTIQMPRGKGIDAVVDADRSGAKFLAWDAKTGKAITLQPGGALPQGDIKIWKYEAAPAMPIKPAPPAAGATRRLDDLEKKLEAVMRELERVRREMKANSGKGTRPGAGSSRGTPPPVPAPTAALPPTRRVSPTPEERGTIATPDSGGPPPTASPVPAPRTAPPVAPAPLATPPGADPLPPPSATPAPVPATPSGGSAPPPTATPPAASPASPSTGR